MAEVGTSVPSSNKELGTRIRQTVQRIGTIPAAAVIAEISVSQLKRYMNGENDPSFAALAKLAAAADVSLDWLAHGDRLIGELTRGAANDPTEVRQSNRELMGWLSEGMVKLYEELGVKLQPVAIGHWAAERHNMIASETSDPIEQKVMVRMALAELRRNLTASNTDTVSSKHLGSAS